MPGYPWIPPVDTRAGAYLLGAEFAPVGPVALGFRGIFRKVFACLGLAVISGSRAVIDLAGCVDPNLTRAASRCRRFLRKRRPARVGRSLHTASCGSGRRLPGGWCGGCSRLGCRSWSRCRCGRRDGCRLRCDVGRCRDRRRVPALHTLVAPAGTILVCSIGVSAVLADAGGPGGCARRCLG